MLFLLTAFMKAVIVKSYGGNCKIFNRLTSIVCIATLY